MTDTRAELTQPDSDEHVRMTYPLTIDVAEDRKIVSWLPVFGGLLKFVRFPSTALIPQGKILVTITRGSGGSTQSDGFLSGVLNKHGYESVTYQWLSKPRRDVWWATGRPYTFTTVGDTGRYSRMIEDAAHGYPDDLLRSLFCQI